MRGALVTIIVIGVGIGAMMPSRSDRVASVATAAPARKADKDRRVETVLTRRHDSHFYADADVNGQPVSFVVDTGASMVALTIDDAKRIGVDFSTDRFEVIGSGASGDVRGQMVMLGSVMIDGKRVHDVRGAVVEGLTKSLLGQSYLQHIGSIEVRGDTMRLN